MAQKSTSKNKEELMPCSAGPLSKPSMAYTVGSLERALLRRFPKEDAEAWDHTGVLVGDRNQTIKGIACALDPTNEAIRSAQAMGANVLLTHHPAFINAPRQFGPAQSTAIQEGAAVWEAISCGVALMNFHTSLDVSVEASRVLPGILKLQFEEIVQPVSDDGKKGYGQLCSVRTEDRPLSLEHLGARCTSVFGRQPKMWGNTKAALSRIVTCTGSASDIPSLCVQKGVDCIVCGEIRYHDALSASQAGLAVVELGHDVSEIPLVALLVAALHDLGFTDDCVRIIDQSDNWEYPEAIRH